MTDLDFISKETNSKKNHQTWCNQVTAQTNTNHKHDVG